jgi:shikimate dehydrogenase
MKITGHTQVVGVIGDPIVHTRSPAMHNAAFGALGMDWVYVPFHVHSSYLAQAIAGFQALGVRGINATIPHKEALVSLMTTLSPEAEFIGAVNTVLFEPDGRIFGDNTDAYGFVAAMEEAGIEPPHGGRAVILGAGGAARAVIAALVKIGVAEVVIANRTYTKAERLAAEVSRRTAIPAIGIPLDAEAMAIYLKDCPLLVNTTSGGMDGKDPLNLNGDLFGPQCVVYDIIYTPPQTPLLKAAAAKGCRVLNGLGMLVHQGARAFQRWTGVVPPVEVMRTALLASL